MVRILHRPYRLRFATIKQRPGLDRNSESGTNAAHVQGCTRATAL